jgi:hypothetical protein
VSGSSPLHQLGWSSGVTIIGGERIPLVIHPGQGSGC